MQLLSSLISAGLHRSSLQKSVHHPARSNYDGEASHLPLPQQVDFTTQRLNLLRKHRQRLSLGGSGRMQSRTEVLTKSPWASSLRVDRVCSFCTCPATRNACCARIRRGPQQETMTRTLVRLLNSCCSVSGRLPKPQRRTCEVCSPGGRPS